MAIGSQSPALSGTATVLLGELALLKTASSVTLTGLNNVTVAQAFTLSASNNFSVAYNSAMYVVDTLTNLLATAPTASSNISHATDFLLTGHNTVTASQAETLSTLKNFSMAVGGTLTINDTVANMMANAAGCRVATSITLAANTVVTAAQAAFLASLTAFHFQYVVQDTAANLFANPTGLKAASAVVVTGSSGLSVAQMVTLSESSSKISLGAGAKLQVLDTAANLASYQENLEYNGSSPLNANLVSGFSVVGGVNSVTVYQAEMVAVLKNFSVMAGSSMVVNDGAYNIGTNFDTLQALAMVGYITSITPNDGGKTVVPITISATQWATDTSALHMLPSTATLSITNVDADNMASVTVAQATGDVSSFTAFVSAANISAGLVQAVNNDSKFSGLLIVPTPGGTENLNTTSFFKPIEVGAHTNSATYALAVSNASQHTLEVTGTPDVITVGQQQVVNIDFNANNTGLEIVQGMYVTQAMVFELTMNISNATVQDVYEPAYGKNGVLISDSHHGGVLLMGSNLSAAIVDSHAVSNYGQTVFHL